VGKSFLIRAQLAQDQVDYISLLDSKLYLLLRREPSQLNVLIQNQQVVIDEVQRVPELLNEVHRLIEEKQIKFLLTGSSARKLRREGINLLAGRAYQARLFPMTWFELNRATIFDLHKFLLLGLFPKAYVHNAGFDYLYAYVDTCLKEEIMAEAWMLSLPNYSRFLEAAALSNTQMINFTKVASDAQLATNTVRDYFGILKDTLLGFLYPRGTDQQKEKQSGPQSFSFQI